MPENNTTNDSTSTPDKVDIWINMPPLPTKDESNNTGPKYKS